MNIEEERKKAFALCRSILTPLGIEFDETKVLNLNGKDKDITYVRIAITTILLAHNYTLYGIAKIMGRKGHHTIIYYRNQGFLLQETDHKLKFLSQGIDRYDLQTQLNFHIGEVERISKLLNKQNING
jgi:hypothetical protein